MGCDSYVDGVINTTLDHVSIPSFTGHGLRPAAAASWSPSLRHVSIPSFTGHGLRRGEHRELGSPRAHFVSIPSFTGHGLRPFNRSFQRACPARQFQSPPSRGMGCDFFFLVVVLSVTAWFQSPPSRGMGCDTRSLRPRWSERFRVSIPSFTGHGLRLSTAYVAGDNGPIEFQSPPSRGMGCD